MRTGWNPDKRLRTIERPPAVSIGVLNYVPALAGYHADGLRVLQLCLASIREHADCKLELIVVDNASCPEVRRFLQDEQAEGRIDVLILNRRNLGEYGIIQIFGAAAGDFVFYSDWDIYHRPGWTSAHLETAAAFPEAGMIGGRPLRHTAGRWTRGSRRWIEAHSDEIEVETGELIPREWLLEFASTVGGHISIESPEQLVAKWTEDSRDVRISRNGKMVWLGASHMQFMIPRHVIRQLPLEWGDDKFGKPAIIDGPIEDLDCLRIATPEPVVDHIGNVVSTPFLNAEFERLTSSRAQAPTRSRDRGTMWNHPIVRRSMLKLYNWSFDKYQRGTR